MKNRVPRRNHKCVVNETRFQNLVTVSFDLKDLRKLLTDNLRMDLFIWRELKLFYGTDSVPLDLTEGSLITERQILSHKLKMNDTLYQHKYWV